jgi:hypothetical protein
LSRHEPDEEEQSPAESGEKGRGQGEHRSTQHQPDTARGNRVCQGLSGVRVATLLVTHSRWEPYPAKPLVRFCAGRSAIVVPTATVERRTVCHLFLRRNPCAMVRSALCRPSDGQVGALVHQPDISIGGNDPISGGLGKARPSEPVLWMKSRTLARVTGPHHRTCVAERASVVR